MQPLIGAVSDRTDSRRGRRTPCFLFGAVLCAAGPFLMPLSRFIPMTVSLLWLLDAGNNITMEPCRACVSDRLDERQQQRGFLMQSASTGLAQMPAFLTPSLLVRAGMDQDWVDADQGPYTARVALMAGGAVARHGLLVDPPRVGTAPVVR